MFYILALCHCFILICSAIVSTFIVKHLKTKLAQQESVKFVIQKDLTCLNSSFVASFSVFVFSRELIGPFESIFPVYLTLGVTSGLFHSILLTILSLQLAQICFLLRPSLLTEVSLAKQAWTHRDHNYKTVCCFLFPSNYLNLICRVIDLLLVWS